MKKGLRMLTYRPLQGLMLFFTQDADKEIRINAVFSAFPVNMAFDRQVACQKSHFDIF